MIEIEVKNMKRRGGLPAMIAKTALKLFAARLTYPSLYYPRFLPWMHPASYVLITPVCRETAHTFTNFMPA